MAMMRNTGLMLLLGCALGHIDWVVRYGTTYDDAGMAIDVDAAGATVITGYLADVGADPGSGEPSEGFRNDVLIKKLNANSGSEIWSITGGGPLDDQGRAIAVDSSGASLVAGVFQGTATFGSYTLNSGGGYDIFVLKVSPAGAIEWATKAGGVGDDEATALAVDSAGAAYVTGHFRSAVATFGTTDLTSTGDAQMFVLKVRSTGTIEWAVPYGASTDDDHGKGIAVSATGDILVTGAVNASGLSYVEVFKLNSTAGLVWTIRTGGSNLDSGNAIAVDPSGAAVVTGCFVNEFGPNGSLAVNFPPFSLHSWNENTDMFVIRVSPEGQIEWATKAFTRGSDCGYGIALNTEGKSVVTGTFANMGSFGYTVLDTFNYYQQIFVTQLSPAGAIEWGVQAGSIGESNERGTGVAVDASGNAYVTGEFKRNSTFHRTAMESFGGEDLFAMKVSPLEVRVPSPPPPSPPPSTPPVLPPPSTPPPSPPPPSPPTPPSPPPSPPSPPPMLPPPAYTFWKHYFRAGIFLICAVGVCILLPCIVCCWRRKNSAPGPPVKSPSQLGVEGELSKRDTMPVMLRRPSSSTAGTSFATFDPIPSPTAAGAIPGRAPSPRVPSPRMGRAPSPRSIA